MGVEAYELLALLDTHRCRRGKEIDEFFGRVARREVEVYAFMHFFDVDSVLVRPRLQDELF